MRYNQLQKDWDTLSYFSLNGLSMSPLRLLSHVQLLAIQRTTLNGKEEGGQYYYVPQTCD